MRTLPFDAIATLLAGSVVWIVYILEKLQRKKTAARSILTEIQNAEIVIEEIQNAKAIGALSSVLQTDYWLHSGHLLLDQFDFLEQRSITRFYNACRIIQKRIEYFQTEEAEQMKHAGFELQRNIIKLCLEETDEKTYQEKKERMTNRFHNSTYWFNQNAAKRALFDALLQISKITNTSIGVKLKKCAGVK